MATNYRHIRGLENRLGRHYSRFPAFSTAPTLVFQSLALLKSRDGGPNRRSWLSTPCAMRRGRSPKPNVAAGSPRGSTSMTFVRMATSTPFRVRPDHTPDRRVQRNAPDRRDNGAFLDPITDARTCLKTTAGRGIDEACASNPADRPRLTAKRQCRASFDDRAQPLAPHCFNRNIDRLAGDEIRAEPDRERSHPALPFGHSALAHARIDHDRPIRRLERSGKRHDRDRHDLAGGQCVAQFG
jgi:hypothetical protein